MDLIQKDNALKGTGRVDFPAPYQQYYIAFNVVGSQNSSNSDAYDIDDTQIIDASVPPGFYWCNKHLTLTYAGGSPATLSGAFSMADCGSGEVNLHKVG